MKDELRIHIGAHKTATTHLQDTLNLMSKDLGRLGISYLPRHIMRGEGTFLNKLNTPLALPIKLISEENILGQCADVISVHPYLCSQPRVAFINELSQHFDLTVFLSIRSFDRLLSGAYATALMIQPHSAVARKKQLMADISDDKFPSWIEVIARLKLSLPGIKFKIWRQEDYQEKSAQIISEFSKSPIENIPIISKPNNTVTPSYRAILEIERRLQWVTKKPPYWYAMSHDIQMSNLPKTMADKYSLFTQATANRLQALYDDDVSKIKQNWAGDLIEIA